MNDKGMGLKIGSGVSVPLAILLIIFFFLPWVNFTCTKADQFPGQSKAEMVMARASGWQLTIGKMSPAEDTEKTREREKGNDPDARPWFILGILLPVALLFASITGLGESAEPGKTGGRLLIIGIVGVFVMILAANVDYSDEMIKSMKERGGAQVTPEMEKEAREQVKKMGLKTEPTGILWASLALYIVVGICGVLNLVLPKVTSPTPATRHKTILPPR